MCQLHLPRLPTWRRPRDHRILQVVTDPPLGLERWTVDTADDLERVRVLCSLVADPVSASWTDVLDRAGTSEGNAIDVVPGVDPDELTLTALPRPVTTGDNQ